MFTQRGKVCNLVPGNQIVSPAIGIFERDFTRNFIKSLNYGTLDPWRSKYRLRTLHQHLEIIMESSTGHLVLCNHVNLSGCGWLKPDETSSSQLDLVVVYMV